MSGEGMRMIAASEPAGGSRASARRRGRSGGRNSRARGPRASAGGMVLGLVVFTLVVAIAGLYYLPPGLSMFFVAPLQVVLGTVIFVCVVLLVVLTFARLGLYDRTAPLALPEGSVRALIALVLLIIFIIFANVIFGQLHDSPSSEVTSFTGLSRQQVDALPGLIETETQIAGTSDPVRYQGTYRLLVPNESATNLGQQVVTGLLTLVAAISAFYFGSNSVATATSAMKTLPASPNKGPVLTVGRPSQPISLQRDENGKWSSLTLELIGSALIDSGVTATIVSNDSEGRVVGGDTDARFVYTPSVNAVDPVTLRFSSISNPQAAINLSVRVPAPTGEVAQPGGDGHDGQSEWDQPEAPAPTYKSNDEQQSEASRASALTGDTAPLPEDEMSEDGQFGAPPNTDPPATEPPAVNGDSERGQ